jgi:predicted transcriptional regulator
MAVRSKTREISIVDKEGTFDTIFKKFTPSAYDEELEGLSALRRLLSNEKARLINTIKNKKPNSIYELAKTLGRDFKAVKEDIKLLERFGFLEMIEEKKGKRIRHKPVMIVDEVNIIVRL